MAIDMQLVKQLRDATFAPLGDCKNALVEANGDIEKATEILKEKGMAKAGKKSDRETNEGMIRVSTEGGKTIALKLLCETDFVVKNEIFQQLFDDIFALLKTVSSNVSSIDVLEASVLDQINPLVAAFVGKIGENVRIGDVVITDKKAYGYNHPGNKVASIIFFDGDESAAKELALQVAAMNPTYLTSDEVPSDQKAELEVKFTEELKAAGKPEAMIPQIVKGKVEKAFADDVLLEQEYIRDGAKKIKEILPAGFTVSGFVRLAI